MGALHVITHEGLRFRVVEDGAGPAVLLLHGFPDTAEVWRHQVASLASNGFRAIAPDQRGCGASDKPQDVDAYRIDRLVGDAVAVLDTMGIERAHVVGHDFGAVVAWMLAMVHPSRVDKLVAVSVGKPGVHRRSAKELRDFWYMFVFQFTGIAEEAFARDDFALLREWVGPSAPDIERYVERFRAPGALTAAMNWYRACARPEMLLRDEIPLPPVEAPTLGVWGARDIALSEEQMTASSKGVTGPWRYERFDDAGHWLQLEQPERVNDLLVEFLSS